MSQLTYREAKRLPSKAEQLHINLHKKHINGSITAFKFIDKDTKQTVIYVPSLELSGYGDTIEKAREMTQQSFKDFFDFVVTLSVDELRSYLSNLGWKKTMFNKDFSKAYVDGDGVLRDFNADEKTIERLELTAA